MGIPWPPTFCLNFHNSNIDIEDTLQEPVQIGYSQKYDILDWIENLYQESCGFEIGRSMHLCH
jgi:hypothetical protein